MPITVNGIVCEEIVDGFEENFDIIQGPAARKGFLCDWTDRYKVVVGLLGLSHATSIGGGITLNTPAQYPEIATTYAHRISVQPVGPPFQGPVQIAWPKCIVWAEYRTAPWSFQPFNQIDGGTPFIFAEQRLSSSSEMLQIPGAGCKWATSGLYLTQPAGIRLVLIEMEITIKELPYMPSPEVFAAAGKINNAPYLGVAAGSLLFQGVSTQQRAVSDGTFVQEASYRFTARSVRWDYQYDPAQQAFDQVLFKFSLGGQPIISSIDFSIIIPAEYTY